LMVASERNRSRSEGPRRIASPRRSPQRDISVTSIPEEVLAVPDSDNGILRFSMTTQSTSPAELGPTRPINNDMFPLPTFPPPSFHLPRMDGESPRKIRHKRQNCMKIQITPDMYKPPSPSKNPLSPIPASPYEPPGPLPNINTSEPEISMQFAKDSTHRFSEIISDEASSKEQQSPKVSPQLPSYPEGTLYSPTLSVYEYYSNPSPSSNSPSLSQRERSKSRSRSPKRLPTMDSMPSLNGEPSSVEQMRPGGIPDRSLAPSVAIVSKHNPSTSLGPGPRLESRKSDYRVPGLPLDDPADSPRLSTESHRARRSDLIDSIMQLRRMNSAMSNISSVSGASSIEDAISASPSPAEDTGKVFSPLKTMQTSGTMGQISEEPTSELTRDASPAPIVPQASSMNVEAVQSISEKARERYLSIGNMVFPMPGETVSEKPIGTIVQPSAKERFRRKYSAVSDASRTSSQSPAGTVRASASASVGSAHFSTPSESEIKKPEVEFGWVNEDMTTMNRAHASESDDDEDDEDISLIPVEIVDNRQHQIDNSQFIRTTSPKTGRTVFQRRRVGSVSSRLSQSSPTNGSPSQPLSVIARKRHAGVGSIHFISPEAFDAEEKENEKWETEGEALRRLEELREGSSGN
jgi:hypothetical protein